MKRLLIAAALALAPAAARAGEVVCWFEEGVVVVPASVAGVAGDYILDTGAARTQLHETRAQEEGVTASSLTGDVRLAGLAFPGRSVAVVDLDARTYAFPTPIAGVIGADVLTGEVLDVAFAPCRVALHPPGAAPAFAGDWMAMPVRVAVSDGPRALATWVTPATGEPLAVRLDDTLASAPGAENPHPGGASHGRLRALSFAGVLFENARAGLAKGDGVLGTPVLSRWRLRFDFARGRLGLAPAG